VKKASKGHLGALRPRYTRSNTRYKYRISSPPLPAGTCNVNQVRKRYGVSMWVVYYWIDSGLITAQKRKPGLPYVITITDATDRRLRDWVANSSRITIRSPNTN